jgi:acyl carrier protein
MEDEIIEKIAEITRHPVEDVRMDRPLRELVPDSFGLVEMAIELQEIYPIQVDQTVFATVHTVGDLTRLIVSRMLAAPTREVESEHINP